MIIVAIYLPAMSGCDIYHFDSNEEIVGVDKEQSISVLSKLLRSATKFHGDIVYSPIPGTTANLYIAPADASGVNKAVALYQKCLAYQEKDETNAPKQTSLF